MYPVFRTDLRATREEQQGIVLYRVEDPVTNTSFRLYEIEYLIAKKMDGVASFNDIIQAIKNEYNFDIALNDLKKFSEQLQSLGFSQRANKEKPQVEDKPSEELLFAGLNQNDLEALDTLDLPKVSLPELTLAVDAPKKEVLGSISVKPRPAQQTKPPPIRPQAPASSSVDDLEVTRLIKSALVHLRNMEWFQARDYALAANEVDPADARVLSLLRQIDHALSGKSADFVAPNGDAVWSDASKLFPEFVEDVLSLTDKPAQEDDVAPKPERRRQIIELSFWTIVIAASIVAAVWVVNPLHFFDRHIAVELVKASSQRLPLFYPGHGASIEPKQTTSVQVPAVLSDALLSDSPLRIDTISVQNGSSVHAGDLLVSLKADPQFEAQIREASNALDKAQRELTVMESKAAQSKGAVRARVAEALKKHRATVWEIEVRWKGLRDWQEALSIKADTDGIVSKIEAKEGDVAQSGQTLLVLQSAQRVLLFEDVKDASAALDVGDSVLVSKENGVPVRATVSGVNKNKSTLSVELQQSDSLVGNPKEWRLVQETVRSAFSLSSDLVHNDLEGDAYVLSVQNGAVRRLAVRILKQSGQTVWVADVSGRDKKDLTIARPTNGAIWDNVPEGAQIVSD